MIVEIRCKEYVAKATKIVHLEEEYVPENGKTALH